MYGGGDLGPLAELDGSGAVGPGSSTASSVVPDYMARGDETYRLVTDERGSVRKVVDVATGAVAQAIEYDPYGRVLSDSAPGFQPFGFAGGLYDADTGLVRSAPATTTRAPAAGSPGIRSSSRRSTATCTRMPSATR